MDPSYSAVLFNEIFDKILKFCEKYTIRPNGMWAFSYLKGADSLKTAFIRVNEDIQFSPKDLTDIYNVIVDCNYGSLGHSFRKATSKGFSSEILLNTFNDPRGVVCYLDSKIKQEHAIFLPIISNDEILGMLDIFFSGDISEEFHKVLVESNNKEFQQLCVNAFKIRQFEELLVVQDSDIASADKRDDLDIAIRKIENNLTLSSTTPLFYFKNNDEQVSSKLVGFNFDYIHGLISHEYRFCSLIKNTDCYRSKATNYNEFNCINPFLQRFFFSVLESLKCNSYKSSITVGNVVYLIEYYGYQHVTLVLDSNKIEKEVNEFKKNYSSANIIGTNKFQDELIFSNLKDQLQGVQILILNRDVSPYLITRLNCGCIDYENKNRKELISPSKLLPIQYSEQVGKLSIFQDKTELDLPSYIEKSNLNTINTVHFEIIDVSTFINELKKRISHSPSEYSKALLPYIKMGKNSETDKVINSNLTMHIVGADPLEENNYRSLINEQINLISGLIQEKETLRHATRAAISQVMARNMSHNIGSHVLSRLVDKGQIEILKSSENNYENQHTSYIGYNSNKKSEKDPDKLIAYFNSYLKSRMDFLADITTGVPTIENSKWFFKELVLGFDKNRLLLNRISGVGNFYYKLVIRLNDEEIKESLERGECVIRDDFMVSIPNDILGCHAFYVIIENIIRNTAKHGNGESSPSNPVIITINVKDCLTDDSDEFYEVNIHDNIPINGNEKHSEDNVFKNCAVSKLEQLVFEQNSRLNNPIINKGILRQGAWGLIEMDASAAYLRKISIEKIDTKEYKVDLSNSESSYLNDRKGMPLNILKAIEIECDKKKSYLGYKFFIYKPREILIIDLCHYFDKIKDEKRIDFLKEGVLICNTQQENKYYYNNRIVYNHKLVLCVYKGETSVARKYLEANITGLSNRIMYIEYSDIILNEFENINSFKENVWIKYIKSKQYNLFSEYQYLPINSSIYQKEVLSNNINESIAYYLDHGENYPNDDTKIKKIKYPYFEIKYSAVNEFQPKVNDIVSQIQLIESVHNKIVIIDERIQEYSIKGSYKPEGTDNEIQISRIYHLTNIVVPSIDDFDLNKQSFDDQFYNIVKGFECNIDASFFVVHLGIIEKLIESYNRLEEKENNKQQVKVRIQYFDKDKEVERFLKALICGPYNIDYNKIIIISGRGTPHNLPLNTRYLNYSIISQYMIDIRFKLLLSEAIFSARRIIK